MTVYMEVTSDKYELPIAVADTMAELSRMTGVSETSVNVSIWRNVRGLSKGKYRKVEIEEGTEE